jgi:hypothetical protein
LLQNVSHALFSRNLCRSRLLLLVRVDDPLLRRRDLLGLIRLALRLLFCVGGCRQPSSNLYFIIATIMIIIIKAI